MAHLNDLQKGSGVIRDYSLVESLIWAKQDGQITDYELLSYGTQGLFVFNLLNAPDLKVFTNGEESERKIQHFCVALNDSEPTSYTPYGVKTGRQLEEKQATASIKKETPTDAYRFFDGVIDTHPANSDPSHINNWVRYWHVALANKLGFIAGRIAGMYRQDVGLENAELWQFVNANVLEMSPQAMRKAWENEHGKVEKPRAQAKPKTQKTRVAKASETSKRSERSERSKGTEALKVALEKADVAPNGK